MPLAVLGAVEVMPQLVGSCFVFIAVNAVMFLNCRLSTF
jgi:hypothetical protein